MMGRRSSNTLHLLAGIVLLGLSGYCFWELAITSKAWFEQRLTLTHRAAKTAKSTGGDAMAGGEIYGVLGAHEIAPAAPKAVSAKSGPAPLVDRVYPMENGRPNCFLHRQLSVESYQVFGFDVPAHTAHPRLEGSFRGTHAGERSGSGIRVEVLLMNQSEFAKFSQGGSAVSALSERPASHADIDWDLKPTFGNRERYYLVFRNSSTRPGAAVVDANFTARFDELP